MCCILALACATPSPEARVPAAAADVPRAQSESWLTELDREHALVGRVWDEGAQRFVTEAQLLERVKPARFVLLGERHDNPDHHRLQARVLTQLVTAGRKPAVVLEMLEAEQQPLVDDYRARPDASAAAFGAAVAWEKSSWPAYAEYQPIFEAAFAANLPIVAGNLAHSTARSLVKQGLAALPPERVQTLRLDQRLPEASENELIEELRASHCGHLPEAMLAPMALAQHARDAQMARALLDAPAAAGAVLIAGAGHVRRDRGVPYYLALGAPQAPLVSIAFLEVEHGVDDAAKYVPNTAGGLPVYDFVWFTPRRSDEDPCAAFRKTP
jgi:uncharacterized iron-regulated protein